MAIIKIRNAAIDLDAAEIPNLPATKITSGTLDNARISLDAAEIPNLDTAKITTGTLADARVPNLNASKITAGTIATARLGSGTANSSTFLRGDNTFASAGGTNTPAFMAYLSGSQSIPNTTGTKIIFQTEIFDTDSAYNTSDGLFTVPTNEAGKYCFNFATRLTNWNLASQGQIFIRVNGSTDKLLNESGDTNGDNNTFMSCGIINLSVGDTVGVYVYQDGGNGASLRSGEQNSYFSGYKLIT